MKYFAVFWMQRADDSIFVQKKQSDLDYPPSNIDYTFRNGSTAHIEFFHTEEDADRAYDVVCACRDALGQSH